MNRRLNPKDFGLKLYSRFPESYRADDVDQKYALKRYLEAAADGGFKYIIEEQNGILDLVNPQTAPLEAVYLLYEQYGLELFHGIPEEFLRSFLPNLGIAWSKKGSLDVVEFIVSSLSGIKTSTEVTYDEHGNPLVTVRLEMDFSMSDYFPDTQQFNRILENFIPFYCDALMLYSYVYYEEQNLRGREELLDFVNEKTAESGSIFYGVGYRPYTAILNDRDFLLNKSFILVGSHTSGYEVSEVLNSDVVLNNTFILNPAFKVLPQYDVDACIDRLIYTFKEEGSIKRDTIFRKYRSYLGTSRYLLNNTFILNEDLEGDKTNTVLNNEDTVLNTTFVLNKKSSYEVGGYLGDMILGDDYLNGSYTYDTTSMSEYRQVREAPVDDFTDRIIPVPMIESKKIRTKEYAVDTHLTHYEESAEVYAKGVKDVQSSLLDEAVMGESVFNDYGDYSDVCRDKLTQVTHETTGIKCSEHDTQTGLMNTGALLNVSLYLCGGIDSVDTIYMKGALNSSLVLNQLWVNANTKKVCVL